MSSRSRRNRPHLAQFRRRTEPGAPPGVVVPDATVPRGRVHIIAFDAERSEELNDPPLDDIPKLMERWPVVWVNVDGVGDAALITQLGRLFHLHRLALEDVVHVHQRAKAESYESYYFVVGRMHCDEAASGSEQISMFLGPRFLLTFQERPGGDCLGAVRTRIRAGWGLARASRPDYLLYALLDVIVDHYFPLVERCGERLDFAEDLALASPMTDVMSTVHDIKRSLIGIRRAIWPMRDAINTLLRDDSSLISADTRVYLRDVHDHTIQIIDLVESYRDIASGITEVHLAQVSLRTNEIMKVLTIISTVFIPLTFVAGIYGMNFDRTVSPWSMPELGWRWGYVSVIAAMAAGAVGMLYFFRRRGWLGKSDRPDNHV